jgi:hypothetical protein
VAAVAAMAVPASAIAAAPAEPVILPASKAQFVNCGDVNPNLVQVRAKRVTCRFAKRFVRAIMLHRAHPSHFGFRCSYHSPQPMSDGAYARCVNGAAVVKFATTA